MLRARGRTGCRQALAHVMVTHTLAVEWQEEREQAKRLRDAEVPFIVYNIPSLVCGVVSCPNGLLALSLCFLMADHACCVAPPSPPHQERTRRKWTNEYLTGALGTNKFNVEISEDNHQMFYHKSSLRGGKVRRE